MPKQMQFTVKQTKDGVIATTDALPGVAIKASTIEELTHRLPKALSRFVKVADQSVQLSVLDGKPEPEGLGNKRLIASFTN